VILVDANLLIYAVVPSFRQHAAARTWLDEQLSGAPRVGLPWESVLSFVRITTNPRVFERPASVAEAWNRVEQWLDAPPVWQPAPTENHAGVLKRLLGVVDRAQLVHDAHLAALAIEHGLTLMSSDGDFARFPDLRWSDPLAGSGSG
jgi:toxin-antitoxin system PIN domain toxin